MGAAGSGEGAATEDRAPGDGTTTARVRGARSGPSPALDRLARSRRLVLAVFWGAAVLLAPWIVLLFGQQAKDGLAHHLHVVWFGISAITVLGMVVVAERSRSGSRDTVIAGVATATLLCVTAWFNTVTAAGDRFVEALIFAVLVQLPIATLCVLAARYFAHPRRAGSRIPVFLVPSLVVAAVAFVGIAVVLGRAAPSVQAASHLRLVWTGLDIFELIGLVAVGWCVWHRLPSVAPAGAFTGTLLFCDAWFNVMATTGSIRLAGLVMAGAELPLAALSFAVARTASADGSVALRAPDERAGTPEIRGAPG